MKKVFVMLSMLCSTVLMAQVAGNSIYGQGGPVSNAGDSSFRLNTPNALKILTVRGLANVKADSYVAIFSINQVGKTADEATKLMDERISQIQQSVKTLGNVETFVDMISMVPTFDYEVEKKIFSKRTYNEVPVGFELCKNIHIKYHDAAQLDKMVSLLASFEVYDLVKVDYISNKLEEVRKQMRVKGEVLMKERVNLVNTLEEQPTSSYNKYLEDGFNVLYPVQRYSSYNAYSSSSITGKRAGNVNNQDKKQTTYYSILENKNYDFVINSEVMEPVIQVEYEMKLTIDETKAKGVPAEKEKKEIYVLTPSGNLQKLNF